MQRSKTCTACKADKPLDAFYVKLDCAQGVTAKCKECLCAWERTRQTRRRDAQNGYANTQNGSDVEIDVGEWDEEERTNPEISIPVDVVPVGHRLKGVSTLVDADGVVKQQWIKTNQSEQDRLVIALEALSTIAVGWTSVADPVPVPVVDTDRLLTVYPMGDPHIGMLSWEAETGASFDLKIAERNACRAIDRLVDLAPKSKTALLVNIGDFFHSDSRKNQTTSGTPVDVDGRLGKIMGVGVRIMRYHIDRILAKHEEGVAFMLGGNHDADMAQMLQICLSQFYEREPRVKIASSPAKFQHYRFGRCLFGFTHGDTVKIDALGGIMACDWPQDWAETLHRYWITGHIHHKTVTELRGCVVESLRTLASADAWHRGQGYRSGRDMQAIVYDHDLGEVLRHRVGIAEIERDV